MSTSAQETTEDPASDPASDPDGGTPDDPTEPPPGEAAPARRMRFPTALTVLAIVLGVVWVGSFFIPAGTYDLDPETGGPVPGSYAELPSCDDAEEGEVCSNRSLGQQFATLWRATPNGLYGIEGETGQIGPWEEGFLYGSAQIFLFVLAVGAFITMTMRTGAIETGIARLALRFRHSPSLLVIVLMSVFALGGTTYGMWEETLGFFALMVPLTLALGYDRMVAAAIILFGAGTGVLASTINPFATGVASDAAGISLTDGMPLRLVMLAVLVPTAIAYVLWYGRRVRADQSRSLLAGVDVGSAGGPELADEVEAATEVAAVEQGGEVDDGAIADVEPLTGRQKVVLVLFGFTFLTMIYGFVPWADIWDTVFSAEYPLPTLGDFYFTEASMLFIVAAVVIGLVARFGEERIVATLVRGASDFLGAALIIVVARGITVVMQNTYITDTILHWMEEAVSGESNALFTVLAWIVNIPIAFLVPSSSGHAVLVMPILAPLSGFADVSPAMAVTAYQSASGFVNYLTPTSAVVMGGLALAKVPYNRYLRFAAPLLVIMFVLVTAFMVVGTLLS